MFSVKEKAAICHRKRHDLGEGGKKINASCFGTGIFPQQFYSFRLDKHASYDYQS